MKIVKEVKISACIDDVWAWLTASDKLATIMDQRIAPEAKRNEPGRSVNRSEAGVVLTATAPEKLIVGATNPMMPLITTFELAQKGRGTNLRVTIRGWEKIAAEKTLKTVPKVSLEWEKRLGQIKKAIESVTQASDRGDGS